MSFQKWCQECFFILGLSGKTIIGPREEKSDQSDLYYVQVKQFAALCHAIVGSLQVAYSYVNAYLHLRSRLMARSCLNVPPPVLLTEQCISYFNFV